MEFKHIPVLFHEIMDIMAPKAGEVFVDCTLGGGGHSRGFLERMGDDGRLIGIDQDTNALKAAQDNLAELEAHLSVLDDSAETQSQREALQSKIDELKAEIKALEEEINTVVE